MTGLETLQSVQYVTVKGKRLAALSADDNEEKSYFEQIAE